MCYAFALRIKVIWASPENRQAKQALKGNICWPAYIWRKSNHDERDSLQILWRDVWSDIWKSCRQLIEAYFGVERCLMHLQDLPMTHLWHFRRRQEAESNVRKTYNWRCDSNSGIQRGLLSSCDGVTWQLWNSFYFNYKLCSALDETTFGFL